MTDVSPASQVVWIPHLSPSAALYVGVVQNCAAGACSHVARHSSAVAARAGSAVIVAVRPTAVAMAMALIAPRACSCFESPIVFTPLYWWEN